MRFAEISNQKRVVKILQGVIKNKRIPHAYLFCGPPDDQKELLARLFAQTLNCEKGGVEPCLSCLSCQKAEKSVHPDLIVLEPEGTELKIDQIRQLKELTRYGPSEGSWQVVLIKEAHRLKLPAANSFLKLLEEPPLNVLFILMTSSPEALPSTILSRCQKVVFSEALEENPKPEFELYQNLKSLKEKSPYELLSLAKRLEGYKEEIEMVLGSILESFWKEKKLKATRIVMEALKAAKKRANLRLTLEVMCLRLGEI